MKSSIQSMLLITLTAATFNAHALCINSDGSLDDPSMSPSSIATDMLPACEKSQDQTTEKHNEKTGPEGKSAKNNSEKQDKQSKS